MPNSPAAAKSTYDAFAPVYDAFNCNYQYKAWTGRLLAAAEDSGLVNGRRLLDLGCGTGLSFLPLLERGWEVTGCDISLAMLEQASEKFDDPSVELILADLRDLPIVHGEFDLIWAVNDTINYLGSVSELISAFTEMSRNLSEGGRIVFDVNTMLNYRNFFAGRHDVTTDSGVLKWRGLTRGSALKPGAFMEARIETQALGRTHVHRQRHFRSTEIDEALRAAGLTCLSVLGENDGELTDGADESLHTKAVYVCSGTGVVVDGSSARA